MLRTSDFDKFFPPEKNVILTNYGRAAFEQIVQIEGLSDAAIMLPAFICRYGFDAIFEKYRINPIFVDVSPGSYHIDFEKAEERISEVDALLLVHAFGLPVEMERWTKLCAENHVLMIEDCARALGAKYQHQPVGSFGDYSIYSFYKVTPVIRGGGLVGNVSEEDISLLPPLYDPAAFGSILPGRLRDIAEWGYEKVKNRSSSLSSHSQQAVFEARRLDRFNELVFRRYLKRLPRRLEENRRKALLLKSSLEDIGFEFQEEREGRVYYKATAAVPGPCNRDGLINRLRKYGVSASTTWEKPWSKLLTGEEFEGLYPETYRLSESIIHFPIQDISQSEIETIARESKEFTHS